MVIEDRRKEGTVWKKTEDWFNLPAFRTTVQDVQPVFQKDAEMSPS